MTAVIEATNVEVSTPPADRLEITVSCAELLRELTAAQGVVERKTTIPILASLLLEAKDDRLTITATDLDQSLKTSCAARVKQPGACTIPARKLYDYVKLLPEGELSLRLMENGWLQIRVGRVTTKIAGMDRAAFPLVPAFPAAGGIRIPVASLRTMIERTLFAASTEDSRYTLNGALLVLKAESMTMVATDEHRLAHIELHGESLAGVTGEKSMLVPRKAMQELLGLLGAADVRELELADDEQTLYFRVGGQVLTSRKLHGQFRNYEAVLPRDNHNFAIVHAEDLMRSIQRVAQFAEERSNAIDLTFEANELKVSSSMDHTGESEEIIETPYSHDPLVIRCNSRYLLDFLRAIGNQGEVRLEFKDAHSAGQMRPEDGKDEVRYRYIFMPMSRTRV